MVKLHFLSKKIHRLFVLIITVLIVVMAVTGTMLGHPSWFVSFDLGMVRFVHNRLSDYFTVVLVLMLVSGLYMYFFPILNKRRIERAK